ncbi:MAG: hypothetical protein EB069_05395 [Actinobacteria bacterium]|nr:hypothetical protein [Actinomycetota bacterium]
MELPIYRMTVDEVDEGVQFVALVDMPAIEKPFQAFAKTPQRFAETGERRVLTGPLMLADTPIFRKDDTYGEYYVVFDSSKATSTTSTPTTTPNLMACSCLNPTSPMQNVA